MAYRSFSIIPTFGNHLISDRFAQMDNLFSRITGEKPLSDIPSYDLLRKNKNNYEMSVSVPGYTQDELDISVLNNKLTISGKPKIKVDKSSEKSDVKWLHQGIKKGEFSFSFSLENRIKISKANLNNGLLVIQFSYDIPEQEKPKKVYINVHHDKSSCMFEQSSS